MATKITETTRKKMKELSHPDKMKILTYLHENGPTYVKALYKAIGLEQAVCSLYLGHLKKVKLLKSSRESRKVFYDVNYEELQKAMDEMKEFFSQGVEA